MSDFTSQCPSAAQMIAVLEGQADEELLSSVIRHLDRCENCVRKLEDLTGPSVAESFLPSDIESEMTSKPKTRTARNSKDIEEAEQRFVERLKSSFHFMTPTSIGHYDVVKKVGQGMMGEVFECVDTGNQARVAVKTIRNHVISPVMVTRISQEARMLQGLDHPNIVKFIEFGVTIDGMPFLALEFVRGGTLSEYLRKNRLTPKQAAILIRECAEALEHAHSRGVLHRDLKPSNILLEDPDFDTVPALTEGKVLVPKIADFGLARYFEGETHVTQSGSLIGTPGYMSPEQINSGNRLGPETDIYSLGTILYEALTGTSPFRAPTLAGVLHQIQEVAPESPRNILPGIPRNLEAICLKCLEKRPEDRYESASELAADLHRFLKDEPILARPLPVSVRFGRWCRANRGLAVSLLFSAFLLFVTAVGGISFGFSQARLLRSATSARTDAERQREIAVGERDFAVQLMNDATSALYTSFLMTQDGDLSGIPAALRLRERIAGEFFEMANTARKIPHLDRDKPIYLCGLIHKSAIIQWEMQQKAMAFDLVKQFFVVYDSIPKPLSELDGLTAQVIDLQMLLGEEEFELSGLDAAIALSLQFWDQWYGKSEKWGRESVLSMRSLKNQGHKLVAMLKQAGRWDDLVRIETQLRDVERTLSEISR